jgi:hypothetical protein
MSISVSRLIFLSALLALCAACAETTLPDSGGAARATAPTYTVSRSNGYTFDAASAVGYIRSNAFRQYSDEPGASKNPGASAWKSGGIPNKCDFFVSQAIIAGLLHTISAGDTYADRSWFFADRPAKVSTTAHDGGWWFDDINHRGSAFTGVAAFTTYVTAQINNSGYEGLRLTKVGTIQGGSGLSAENIHPGDVLVMYWNTGTANGDHMMMVTTVDAATRGSTLSTRLRMGGQEAPYVDVTLADFERANQQKWGLTTKKIEVYRVTGYSVTGINPGR